MRKWIFLSRNFNKLALFLIFCFLLSNVCFAQYKPQIMFYARPWAFAKLTPKNTFFTSFEKNSNAIDVISAQDIHVKTNGNLIAMVNPEFVKIAKQKGVKIIPVVVNMGFNSSKTSVFLHNQVAQKRAIANLLQLAVKNKLDGVQIDFERIKNTDRDLFTKFYHDLAQSFHRNNLLISAAVTVGPINDKNCYDYKKLGEDSDFVTIMAYDEHGPFSAPGPIASNASVEKIIKKFLPVIPAGKISLGVPCYSGFWQIAGKTRHGTNLTYKQVQKIKDLHNINWNWNNKEKVQHATFTINNSHTIGIIYLENAKSFAAEVSLAEKYHLYGISAWRLGQEDPQIWNYL